MFKNYKTNIIVFILNKMDCSGVKELLFTRLDSDINCFYTAVNCYFYENDREGLVYFLNKISKNDLRDVLSQKYIDDQGIELNVFAYLVLDHYGDYFKNVDILINFSEDFLKDLLSSKIDSNKYNILYYLFNNINLDIVKSIVDKMFIGDIEELLLFSFDKNENMFKKIVKNSSEELVKYLMNKLHTSDLKNFLYQIFIPDEENAIECFNEDILYIRYENGMFLDKITSIVGNQNSDIIMDSN